MVSCHHYFLVKGTTIFFSFSHKHITWADMAEEHEKRNTGGPSTSAMEEEEEEGEESTSAVEREKEEGRTKEEEGRVGGTTTAGGTVAARNLQVEIDNILEETARRKNLSVINVKSILRVSVISMKSVGS